MWREGINWRGKKGNLREGNEKERKLSLDRWGRKGHFYGRLCWFDSMTL